MLTHGPAIEAESFRIIDETLAGRFADPRQQAIVRRIVHATADFDFVENTVFSPNAIDSGIAALSKGCTIVTDVNMLREGIIQRLIDPFGAKKACYISDSDLPEKAAAVPLQIHFSKQYRYRLRGTDRIGDRPDTRIVDIAGTRIRVRLLLARPRGRRSRERF